MAATPNAFISPQAIKTAAAVVTLAGTDVSDAPTNTALLYKAGPNGARLTKVAATPRAAATASRLQLFRSLDAGVTKRWFKSVLMPAQSFAVTTVMASTDFGYSDINPLILGPNEELHVSSAVAMTAGIVFDAEGGDF